MSTPCSGWPCYAVMRALQPRRDDAQLPAADVRQSANVADLFASSLPEGGLAPIAAAYRRDPRHRLCPEAQRATDKGIPRNVYFAWGFNEQFLAIFPTQKLVVVRLGAGPASDPAFRIEFFKRVVDAL
jgi:hypothetical protein